MTIYFIRIIRFFDFVAGMVVVVWRQCIHSLAVVRSTNCVSTNVEKREDIYIIVISNKIIDITVSDDAMEDKRVRVLCRKRKQEFLKKDFFHCFHKKPKTNIIELEQWQGKTPHPISL